MRKLIRKIVSWAFDNDRQENVKSVHLNNVHQRLANSKYTRFTVYQATGGIVIETIHSNSTNSIKGEPDINLYVIASMDDLPNEIAKIITYDKLLR